MFFINKILTIFSKNNTIKKELIILKNFENYLNMLDLKEIKFIFNNEINYFEFIKEPLLLEKYLQFDIITNDFFRSYSILKYDDIVIDIKYIISSFENNISFDQECIIIGKDSDIEIFIKKGNNYVGLNDGSTSFQEPLYTNSYYKTIYHFLLATLAINQEGFTEYILNKYKQSD